MKILSILIWFLFPLGDSLQPVAQNLEFLYQLLLEQTEDRLSEALGIDGESGEDSHEELIEDYLYYLENPINVNSEEVVHLEEIGLLSAFQVEALRQYRRQFGDLMFALINAARLYKIRPDNALEQTNLKFMRRFNYVEQKAREQGRALQDMSLEEMDELWNEAKKLQ